MRAAVLIPSFNTGRILSATVQEVLGAVPGTPVVVVIDGSTDGSRQLLAELENTHPDTLHVLELPANRGKGAAILHGAQFLLENGASHVLVMDADGQHPAESINRFIDCGRTHPQAAVFGRPVFDASAPALRVKGRKVSNFWANLETLGWGIHDSLFGMRLYPIPDLLEMFRRTRYARRFDFEPEAAVRLAWRGVPIINLDTPVRYLTQAEGGVSQFRYLRDNLLLSWMHTRLFFGFLARLPLLLARGRNPLAHLSPPPQ